MFLGKRGKLLRRHVESLENTNEVGVFDLLDLAANLLVAGFQAGDLVCVFLKFCVELFNFRIHGTSFTAKAGVQTNENAPANSWS